jgi:hypothetical protein
MVSGPMKSSPREAHSESSKRCATHRALFFSSFLRTVVVLIGNMHLQYARTQE